jgi:hypothetical protein
MKLQFLAGFLSMGLALSALACGGTEVDVGEFEGYGRGMPGSGLPEGGEILMERVALSPTVAGAEEPVVQQWFYGFQYGGDFMGGVPAGDVDAGGCFPFVSDGEFDASLFPVHDLPVEADDYVDWGDSVQLSGPDGLDVEVPKVVAPAEGIPDNRPSPIRNHREGTWIYGGPSWQLTSEFADHEIVAGGEYTLSINGGEQDITWHFPPQYDFPFNSGVDDVTIPADIGDEGWDVSWESLPNPNTPQTRDHTFPFVALAQFPAEGDRGPTPMYLCVTPSAGPDDGVVVSKEIVDSLPDMGIFQAGRLTHYMEAVTDNDGVERRIDVFSIECSISVFAKEAAE